MEGSFLPVINFISKFNKRLSNDASFPANNNLKMRLVLSWAHVSPITCVAGAKYRNQGFGVGSNYKGIILIDF